MRTSLASLDHAQFDVCVIGAGANGASAAHHLSAAGYHVLLVDKDDFGSGSSSRSSRLLHCGLRYLGTGDSLLQFIRHPSRLRFALRMAKLCMDARRQMVIATPERVREMKFHFPIWRESIYRPWQASVGLKLLASMAPSDVPLKQRMYSPEQAKTIPLVNGLRDWDRLEGVAAFTEYQIDWAERMCVDASLDAERLGATVRNYTAVTALKRSAKGWEVGLADILSATTATIHAKLVLNMAGIWIDKVNSTSGAPRRRMIFATKGCHIVVQLPPECADYGIVTYNSLNEPFYCIPWRGLHYFGPTETEYTGDLDAIRAEESEVEFLITEANHLLPGLVLKRSDVLSTWAGVRPLSFDPQFPKGKRLSELHDLGDAGMPDVLAMTAGPLLSHRTGALEVTQLVQKRLAPSRPARPVTFSARHFQGNGHLPPSLDAWAEGALEELRSAARDEHATNLRDLMFRRLGLGWNKTMGYELADRVAQAVADIYGWDDARIGREAAEYRAALRDLYGIRPQ